MVLIKKMKQRIRVGVCGLIWAMWNCRNDVTFNNAGRDQFLQVMHRATYWIRMWSYLHNKYLNNKTLSQVTVQPHDSPFWRGLMKVKEDFF
jgi:hypothetical protein